MTDNPIRTNSEGDKVTNDGFVSVDDIFGIPKYQKSRIDQAIGMITILSHNRFLLVLKMDWPVDCSSC